MLSLNVHSNKHKLNAFSLYLYSNIENESIILVIASHLKEMKTNYKYNIKDILKMPYCVTKMKHGTLLLITDRVYKLVT